VALPDTWENNIYVPVSLVFFTQAMLILLPVLLMELEINMSGFSGFSVPILLVFFTSAIYARQTLGWSGVVHVFGLCLCSVEATRTLLCQLLPFPQSCGVRAAGGAAGCYGTLGKHLVGTSWT